MASRSLVQFVELSQRPVTCGYCRTPGSVSQGLWLERLRVQDYQDLLDRGWRRSGRFVYKPSMEVTCCPLYTIRCSAKDFQPSKSQRKVVRRVINFLQTGAKDKNQESITSSLKPKSDVDIQDKKKNAIEESESMKFRRIEGLKKAKIRRAEMKLAKKAKLGIETKKEAGKPIPKKLPKSLSDLVPISNYYSVNEKVDQEQDINAKHKFCLRLVKADLKDREFMRSFHESFSVYQRYQQVVHKESEEDCEIQTFASFLCDSPLLFEGRSSSGGEEVLLGAFHQQYLVDDKIVAVAVLDILPYCVSSVYFYYDPVFWGKGNLSPGTYSALREVQLTKQLATLLPDLCYYYMGYYVHSCPKMTYKGKFHPSDLLSPALGSWHPLPPCRELLDKSKYSDFSEVVVTTPAPPRETPDLSQVSLMVAGKETTVDKWREEVEESKIQLVAGYRQLVGQHLGEVMLLHQYGAQDSDTSDSDSD